MIRADAVIQVWEDRSNERAGYFRAFWCKDASDHIGCPVIGHCSPGGSYRTIKDVVAEVRQLGHTAPIYREGKLISQGTP